MTTTMDDVRRKVWIGNRSLHRLGLATGVTASVGHASMRLPDNPNLFMVKGREMEIDALAVVRPDDLVICDLDGMLIEGKEGLTQVSEVMIHACIYKMRPDIVSVVHAHPRYTVLMSVLNATMTPTGNSGNELVRRPIPVYPHMKTIQSAEEGMGVAKTLGANRSVLLRGHGAVTASTSSVAQAVMSMAQLEQQGEWNYYAFAAEGPNHTHLSDAYLDEVTNPLPIWELPHFKDVLKGRATQRDGVQAFHDLVASKDVL